MAFLSRFVWSIYFLFWSTLKILSIPSSLFFGVFFWFSNLIFVLNDCYYWHESQPKTNGSISNSSPTWKRPAKKSSPSSSTPTLPSLLTLPARSVSWFAARMRTATSRSPSALGLTRRKRSYADTITPTFIARALCCPILLVRRWSSFCCPF